MLSLTLDLGWVGESIPSPSGQKCLDPRQGVWVLVPLWHRDLFILLISDHS